MSTGGPEGTTNPATAESARVNAGPWHRSSACIDSSCVEVAFRDDAVVLVRESRHGRYSQTLRFDHDEWRAFVEGVKNGEFEVPAVHKGR